MSFPETSSFTEPTTDPEILASILALPKEEDLPYDDGTPMETARHRDQMLLLIESLRVSWAGRTGYYVGGNMFGEVSGAFVNTSAFVIRKSSVLNGGPVGSSFEDPP